MDDDLQEPENPNAGIDEEEQKAVADAEKTASDATPTEESDPEAEDQTEAKNESAQATPPAGEQESLVDEAKIYTQSQYDAAIKKHDDSSREQIDYYKDQAAKNKKEADDYKERHSKSCNFARHRDSLLAQAYAQLDERDIKVFQLITKYVQAQLDNEEKSELQEKLRKAEADLKRTTADYARLFTKQGELDKANRELSESVTQLRRTVSEKEAELAQDREELGKWHGIGDRMIAAMVPQCLADKQWFLDLLSELPDGIFADQPSDSAMLVFASLAELAVMERTSAGPCFEWKKQLTDIGLVVASYMHSKKSAEGDVLKMLHNFAQAFLEMPILKKLKIGIRIPSLGGDFKTDEVKHKNNGSVVAKVLNWCIVEDGHVYCKAIVE